jgi:hypothetical protein
MFDKSRACAHALQTPRGKFCREKFAEAAKLAERLHRSRVPAQACRGAKLACPFSAWFAARSPPLNHAQRKNRALSGICSLRAAWHAAC